MPPFGGPITAVEAPPNETTRRQCTKLWRLWRESLRIPASETIEWYPFSLAAMDVRNEGRESHRIPASKSSWAEYTGSVVIW